MPRKGQKLTEEQKQAARNKWAAMTPEEREARTEAMRNLSPKAEKARRRKLSEATSARNKAHTTKTKKIIFTEEMLSDLTLMGDKDFTSKWSISRDVLIKRRKELGIKPFNNQHGTKEHKFVNGVEYKWCQHGHWEPVTNFGIHSSRIDGLRGWCVACSKKEDNKNYYANNGVETARRWRKSTNGKLSLRMTWRKVSRQKRNAFVKWSRSDEDRAFKLFNDKCVYCRIPITLETCEFDHLIPMSKGGLTQPSNMVPCCTDCNHGPAGKFDKEPVVWLATRFKNPIQKYNAILKKIANL